MANHQLLVTGARGFIGSHIVARARDDGLRVVGAYRGASEPGAVHLDVCDPESVDVAFRSVEPSLVIHCAAYGVNYAEQDLDSALAVNLRGSVHVLEAAARCRVRRFVHLGTCFEYGSHPGPIAENAALNPTAVYGASKAAATLLMRERAVAVGIPLIVARPFGTWGPREAPSRLIPQVVRACLDRRSLELTRCEVIRDYLYVEDMAERLIALSFADHVAPGTIVNVASGQPIVLRDLVLEVARLFEAEHLMRFGSIEYRPTEMSSLVADVRRLHELVGARPRTPLSKGVHRMVAQMGSAAAPASRI